MMKVSITSGDTTVWTAALPEKSGVFWIDGLMLPGSEGSMTARFEFYRMPLACLDSASSMTESEPRMFE